jgi:hypothetical protein
MKENNKYKLDKKSAMLKYASITATGIMAGGSVLILGGCSKSNQWAETSGQAGRINLEAVEEAMKKSKDVSKTEPIANSLCLDMLTLTTTKRLILKKMRSCLRLGDGLRTVFKRVR